MHSSPLELPGHPLRVPRGALSRRRLLMAALALPVGAVAIAACGSDDDASSEPTDTVLDTVPPGTEPPADDRGTDRPDDDAIVVPDDGAILEIGYYGGFTPFEFAFQSPPALLIAADGRVIRPAAVIEIYPGPLLPQHTVATLSPDGVQLVLAEAARLGLLAEVDYTQESLVADAATTTVIASTADATYRHEAYALGLSPGLEGEPTEESPERLALAAAVDRLTDLRAVVGDELGEEELWVPDAYQIVAQPIADLGGFEVEPTVVDWPASSGIVLAETDVCTEIARDTVGSLLEDATELTFFAEGDTVYQVVARPAYPGRSC